jgi:hypothetical protein
MLTCTAHLVADTFHYDVIMGDQEMATETQR